MFRSFCSPSLLFGASKGSMMRSLQRPRTLLPPAFLNVENSISINNNNHDDISRRYRSNRSRRGLYDGKDIRSGNSLSFSMKATKRKFKPNVFIKRVYSEVLDEMIKFHLTTSALRSIDKAGGLDNYLLTSKHVQSGEGLAAKKRIVKKLKLEAKRNKAEKLLVDE